MPDTTLLSFIQSLNLSAVEGYCCLWEAPSKKSTFLPTSDTEAIASKALELAKTQNVYMPIALFPEPPEKGRGKASEASHLIGFFADIDTIEKPDPKGHKYAPDKKTARSIIAEIPFKPAFLVGSGYGLHGFWPFSKPLKLHDTAQREEVFLIFKRYQKALESLFTKHGYELDKVGDPVRVFRVPDTLNHKGEKPVPVTILEAYPENRVTIEGVKAYLDEHHPEKAKPKKESKASSLANAELIRGECAWFDHCIDDAGDLPEPEWYAFCSIVGRCEGAEKLVHEYSRDYSGYSEAETTKKLNQAMLTAGPRTCENISTECGGEEYCKQCPHWGKITSPIPLGAESKEESLKAKLLAQADGLEYWRTANDTAYVTLHHQSHKENMLLRGAQFKRWLGYKLYRESGGIAPEQSLREVINTLEGKAIFEGEEHEVYHRVAAHDGKLYIDQGTPDWSVIEVSEDSWKIIPEAPVRFVRSESMKPLPEPVRGGDINQLQHYIPCENEDDFKLVIGLLLGIFAPRHPYPLGVFTGLQGCGKSTRARAIIGLCDPSSAPMVNAPREERDVLASVSGRWLTTFDNVKKVKDNVSDALCSVSTGIAHSSRKYHTNLDVFETIEIARPILMTGIELRLRQDLRSRSIFFEFAPLDAKDCKTEEEYWKAYEKDAPIIFGGMLDALCAALRNYDAVRDALKGVEKPRLADHTVWVSAAEESLGWEPGTYRQLLLKHQREGLADSEMNSTFGQVMLGFLAFKAEEIQKSYIWQVNELYAQIIRWAEDNIGKDERKYIPRSPASFSKKLRRAATSLAYYGAEFAFDQNHEGNKRGVVITLNEQFLEEAKYRVL